MSRTVPAKFAVVPEIRRFCALTPLLLINKGKRGRAIRVPRRCQASRVVTDQ